jgi:hypothetical protein
LKLWSAFLCGLSTGLRYFWRHWQLQLRLGFRCRRFRAVDEFGVGRIVRVDNEQLLLATAENAVDLDLAILDSDNSAGASVDRLAFDAGSVAENNNELLLLLGANERFEPGDPVSQGVHVRFIRHAAEHATVLAGHPSHGDDDKIRLTLEDVKRELEGAPWCFELVRAVSR